MPNSPNRAMRPINTDRTDDADATHPGLRRIRREYRQRDPTRRTTEQQKWQMSLEQESAPHIEAKTKKEQEEGERNDENVLEVMDEVGEDESGVEYEQDEQSEEDMAAEQVEREVQRARAQVEPARGGANPGELAEAEGRAYPEEDPARERERRRQRLRAELQSAQQERDDLRLMLQQLERHPSCPARRYSHADVRHSEQGIICCVFCNAVQQHYSDSCLTIMDVETRRLLLNNNGRGDKETISN
ncbi:hypothetical protein NECAME_09114 [Necator americanus]|uniref:Uncharacterized protein n=1 Tax=Necator americanus TaxID=51031 RepID=W2TEK8_NECAM|nr:hypothetical protein NECAME_09114 [Necator americanus]ETN80490.1 hypothetical protein NECAME_09114 [Necator americanus]